MLLTGRRASSKKASFQEKASMQNISKLAKINTGHVFDQNG